MEYQNNMEFEIQHGFMPNMYNSDRLRVLEVSRSSVIIKMNNAENRSVFRWIILIIGLNEAFW